MKLLGLTLALVLGVADDPPAKDFYHDFRGKEVDDTLFLVTGPNAAAAIKSAPEGLRITLTAEQKKADRPVGLLTRFPVKGDFEITARYVILAANRPAAGFGVGFSIYLMTSSASKEATEFLRLVRPSGAEAYGCSRLTTTPEGKRVGPPGLRLGDIPAAGRSGHMRITRVGAEAVLSAAEEDSTQFRNLYRFDLGTDDVTTLRLAATPGNAHNEVDVLLQDLRVRGLAGQKVLPDDPPRGRFLWVLALLIGAVLVLGGLVALWRIGRRDKDNSR